MLINIMLVDVVLFVESEFKLKRGPQGQKIPPFEQKHSERRLTQKHAKKHFSKEISEKMTETIALCFVTEKVKE